MKSYTEKKEMPHAHHMKHKNALNLIIDEKNNEFANKTTNTAIKTVKKIVSN